MTQITVEGNSEWLSVNCSREERAPVVAVVEFNPWTQGCTGIVKDGFKNFYQHGTGLKGTPFKLSHKMLHQQ